MVVNRICKKCNSTDFCKNGLKKGIQQYHCKPCHKLRQKKHAQSGARRLRDVERAYGISREEYIALLETQNHVCAICKKPESTVDKRTNKPRNLAVDHCHGSQKVRGLLCQQCNQALGLLKDNKQLLASAIKYLEEING